MKNNESDTTNELIYLNELKDNDKILINLYFKKGLTQMQTDNGIAFNQQELIKLQQKKGYINIPDDLTPLKEYNQNDYSKIYYHISKNYIKKYNLGSTIYFSPSEFKKEYKISQHHDKKKGYEVDLSGNEKINCLYRLFKNMNKYNKDSVQKDNRLTRYYNEEGYACINLKEYIKPQLKLLAKKLECKEYEIFQPLYDIIYEKYKKDKGKKQWTKTNIY